MAKIVRKTQKIFGSSAGVNQIAQFGSLAAASPTFSTDPAVIQALSQYVSGWFAAIIGNSNPAIEDMNALFYLFAYQLAYLMQEGVPEWDSATTYYTGSLASDGSGTLYVSLVDNNTNHALGDSTKWFAPSQNGLLTRNAITNTMTLPSGQVMSWPTAVVQTGVTVTVPSGARLSCEGSVTVVGTGALVATGSGVIRVF